jgi:hypothetical protein
MLLQWTNTVPGDNLVEFSSSISGPWTSFTGTVDPTTTQITGLADGTYYYFRVSTIVNSVSSQPSLIATNPTYPYPPGSLEVNIVSGVAYLTWNNNTDPDNVAVFMYFSNEQSSFYAGLGSTGYQIDVLPLGDLRFVVAAIKNGLTSLPSNSVYVTN